jgi:hypothetical protein
MISSRSRSACPHHGAHERAAKIVALVTVAVAALRQLQEAFPGFFAQLDRAVRRPILAAAGAALLLRGDNVLGARAVSGGRPPLLSDSELVCLAVAQAMLGFHSEARWLRYANKHLPGMFPYLPQRAGYNKRLRAALPLIKRMIREIAMDGDFWTDTMWITDSTPVP